MEKNEYGKTGEKVSRLGFGGMRFSNPEDMEESVKTVLKAFELGINYFDTAPNYCEGLSEKIFARALKIMKKTGKEFYISTKSQKASGYELRKDFENSLKVLGVDKIDFYHCWYVLTLEDWENRKRKGAVKELIKLKEEGLAEHIVFSTHLPGNEVRKVVEEGIFEGVTLGYSAINFPYREDGIQAAHENDMGVVVMNPLAGGLIPMNEGSFSFLKLKSGDSILKAALGFLKNEKRINVSLVGFRDEKDVVSAVREFEGAEKYPLWKIEEIRERIDHDFNRLCTSCGYCRVCPVNIEVWKFMETANLLFLKSDQSMADRLKWHWGVSIDDWEACLKCRKCERACTQKIPILERVENMSRSISF